MNDHLNSLVYKWSFIPFVNFRRLSFEVLKCNDRTNQIRLNGYGVNYPNKAFKIASRLTSRGFNQLEN